MILFTVQTETTDEVALTGRNDGGSPDPVFTSLENANLMGVLCFSVLLGLVLSAFRDEQNVVLNVFVSLSNTLMTATHMLLWFAPVGLCSGSMVLVLGAGDLQPLTGDLSMYVMAFVAAIALHGLLVLPTLYLLLTRHQLGPFFRNMVYPMAVALGTSSSSATAPTLIVALEQGLRMDPRLARFLAPVGATMNMDGSAIYFIVTVLFFAQKNAIALTVAQHLVVGLVCSLATLSTSPTPQASRVVLVYLMISLGIPLDGVGMLLHTDWVINRLSTAVNVLGDAVVVSGTQALCRSTLEAPGRDEDGHPE
ncbi:excitatory amino acid transporter 4-like [Dermacentor silvarum]|uniref:excitatory amino acid transporter 4-like n=1 Tax=Dermacentor silvarum TaxID=543639 RepID=UPI0021014B26|nr:excitatory amino acid transporter 4-like [Dermacentor silvarum]